MINIPDDILSLTEFKRNSARFLEQLRETGRPIVLTINGRAELVIQDAARYQDLMDRLEAIEGIRRGLDQMEEGKTVPAPEALEKVRKKRSIPST